ncbi:hypothetical protein K4749_00295 [Streptomyces sp. TRM72054]|uniref:hypothetical protein n=1 Tax=Streptomyces sp. TRM72054 TaxID=2870562 RepID=UPI001C8CCAFF|nr:hypothetical protein [Streptomyces sp. TRM72054]MBX9392075.1 hypothetical protein [Streptomyces sp. TRM72054]
MSSAVLVRVGAGAARAGAVLGAPGTFVQVLVRAGLVAAVAAVLGAVAVRRLAGRRRNELSDVVADALAGSWADRLGVPEDRIRPALTGADDALRARVDGLVGKVSCSFRQEPDAERRHLVVVVVGCDCRDGDSEELTMHVSWRRVPAGVRTELLRARAGDVVRSWTPHGTGGK